MEGQYKEGTRETVLYDRSDNGGCEENKDDTAEHVNNSTAENKDVDLKLYVPNWPFETWGKVCEDTDIEVSPSDEVSPCFTDFINKLSQKMNTFEDDISKSLLFSIQSSINEAAEALRKSHPLFQNSHVKLAGSVSEGTKVGHANEFDFLLLLDVFGDREMFRLYIRQNYMMIEVLDEQIAKYFDNEGMLVLDIKEKCFLNNVRKNVMGLYIDELEKCLPKGWLLHLNDGDTCMAHIATTLHLECVDPKLEIDVDICLCCPILPTDIENTIKNQVTKLRDMEMKLFKYLSKRQEKAPRSLYAIIGSDELVFPGNMYTRIASPSLELEMLSNFGKDDGRIRTYCVAKCLVAICLPKITKIFGCKRCCHNLAPSYILKNILFFMINRHCSDDDWAPNMLSHRVLELFNILRICVTLKTESDMKKSVSTFCTPGNVSLDDISTFNPYVSEDRRSERHGDCLFTEDSHKPLYEISSTPVYVNEYKTNNVEFDKQFEHWFVQLNTEHWNSYALLEQLSLLLQKLSNI